MSNPNPGGSDFVEGIHEAALYAGHDVLLVFDPATTIRGGTIPPHGASGPGHIAFSVRDIAHLESWKDRLEAAGVAVEAEREWPTSGREQKGSRHLGI